MKKIEILAPAGSYESLVAAINAGCDAVYIGGTKFGARAYANNLTEEDLLKAIDYAHLHNKKIYLTINTLLKEEEVEQELYSYLLNYYEQGIDAVIVQDMGVMNFIHKYFYDLPIHASTQLSLTMAEGVDVLSELGVTRLVTSRELSLLEIKSISENTDLEIESFVHGALCYCYSGQCLMSSMLGGRSGNRGRCAQPCRMPYTLVEEGKVISNNEEKYLLSPKDICTLHLIPDLIEAGIHSFKIEGRMKKPEYTALVVSVYRKYVDLYLELGSYSYQEYLTKNKKAFEQDVMMLMDLYNRGGFTSGYYENHNGKDMMANKRPNHSGVLVGKVISTKGINASIKTIEDVNSQDILEIRTNDDEAYEYTIKDSSYKGDVIRTNYLTKYKVRPGQEVYRTKNAKLIADIRELYLKDEIKIPVVGEVKAKLGLPISLILSTRGISVTTYGDEVLVALKQPISKDNIFNQISKINNTSFVFESLTIVNDDNIFIPVAKLNQLRREAINNLTMKIVEEYRREKRTIQRSDIPKRSIEDKTIEGNNKKEVKLEDTCISVHLIKLEQLYEVVNDKDVDSIYLDTSAIEFSDIAAVSNLVASNNKQFYLVLPHIFRKETYDSFFENKDILTNPDITGFVIKNVEEYNFITKDLLDEADLDKEKRLILDYNVYTMNNESKEFWRSKGINHFTAAVELNYQELRRLGCYDSDVIVYGHLPLMVSAQCLIKNTKLCTRKGSDTYLEDRYNKKFYVINHCKYCYNTIYNGSPISLLNNMDEVKKLTPKCIRLDFTVEDNNEMKTIIQAFVSEFKYKGQIKKQDIEISDYTKGHFKRGIE